MANPTAEEMRTGNFDAGPIQILTPGDPTETPGVGPGQGWRPPTMAEAMANPGMTGYGGASAGSPGQFSRIPSGQAGSTESRDALARMRKIFTQYDLPGNLGDWAWGLLQTGKSQDEILLDLNDPSTTGGAAFNQRFPGIAARQKAGLAPIGPAEYIAYEQGWRQQLSAAGFPPSFYDNANDVAQFITNDVSLAELSRRVQNGYSAVKAAPKEVRDEFGRLFGADGDAGLASYMLDRQNSLPALEKAIQSSTAAGMGWRSGFQLNLDQATKLGDRGLSADAYDQGFQAVKGLAGLYNNGQGETDNLNWQTTGIGAVFNDDKAAQQQIKQRVAQRGNEFVGGGGSSSQQGVTGAGVGATY